MLNDRLTKWLSRKQPDRSVGNTIRRSITLSTDVGLIREQNQDRVACMRFCSRLNDVAPFVVIALSDGMGGMKDGAECASRTVAGFFDSIVRNRHLDEVSRISLAAEEANESVYRFAGGYGGATLSAVLVSELGAFIVNVGDSRIYAEVQASGVQLRRLTIDDSLAEIVGGNGRDLLQFIGMGEGLRVKAREVLDEASKVLITSDGVHFVDQNTLGTILYKAPELSVAANRINSLVRWCGAPDNASLAVFSLLGLKEQLFDEREPGIEFWDPFGDFYFSFGRDDKAYHENSYGVKYEKNSGGDGKSVDYIKGGVVSTKEGISHPGESDTNLKEFSLKKVSVSNADRMEELKKEIYKLQKESEKALVSTSSKVLEGKGTDDSSLKIKKVTAGSKRVPRSRKKAEEKNKKSEEGFQIIIEMDSGNREDSDEGSGKV